VGEQVPYGDLLPGSRGIGEVLGDVVVKIQLAFLNQHHHSGRRKLLAHRAGLKDGLRLDRHLMLDICEAITFSQNNLATFDHRERQSRNVRLLHLGIHVLIDLVRDCVLRHARRGQDSDRK
jgi:hypothetical protein